LEISDFQPRAISNLKFYNALCAPISGASRFYPHNTPNPWSSPPEWGESLDRWTFAPLDSAVTNSSIPTRKWR